MHRDFHFAVILCAAALLFGAGASARGGQNGPLPAPDFDGPNAMMRIDGQTASVVDPVGHCVSVFVPGPFTLEIDSGANANQAFILLAKAQCAGGLPCFVPEATSTPWGGSIDMTLAGISVVMDGKALTANPIFDPFANTGVAGVFTVPLNAPAALDGKKICLQAIVCDPTNPPFNLDNTELAGIDFQVPPFINVTCLNAIGDDDFVNVPLTTQSISFYGQIFNSIFINSNGYLSFAGGSSDFTETIADFDGGYATGGPGVSLYQSDLNRGGTASGGSYKITEDGGAGTVEVQFLNQNHWSSQEPAGDLRAVFDAPAKRITFDYSNFIPGTTATDDGIFGVTDGDVATGSLTDLSDGAGTGVSAVKGAFASGFGPDSIAEIIPGNTPFGCPIYDFTDIGSLVPGIWLIN